MNAAPAITSGSTTTFDEDTAGSFTVETSASPTASLSESGALPAGVTFVDNGDGTATLAGTPATGSQGTYPLTITASNGVNPNATQDFDLVVDGPSTITSGDSTTFTVGSAGTFTVTTAGNPTAAISESGTLPGGVTLTDNGDGTATLAGTPASGSGGTYPIAITADNGVGSAEPVLHPDGGRGRKHHERQLGDLLDGKCRQLHGDHQRVPDRRPLGNRCAAQRCHLHRQR